MENFRQQFTLETVKTLKNLLDDWQSAETISGAQKRETFRALHTVKGTAQTFGFKRASRLAHELETLLSIEKTTSNEIRQRIFLEGIEILIESLERKNFKIPGAYAKKLRAFTSDAATKQTVSDDFSFDLPDVFLSQLSSQEKNALVSAQQNEKNLFCLETGFELSDFADGLISFRERLSEAGEIIATLPSAKHGADGKIGFQILFASAVERSKIEAIAEQSAAEMIFDSTEGNSANDAPGILAQVVNHGKEVAETFGKQIRFDVSADVETNVAPDKLKIVFDVLLHLVRNAVDHAIEQSGTVEINLTTEKNNWRLTVCDDGRGIDLNELKRKAAEKNLISEDKILTEQETIDLIFLPEFSTKAAVTEISGRGIGLDAVKSAIENAGGEINVETERGTGTTFEIFLPQ